jgi:hypothetical protein
MQSRLVRACREDTDEGRQSKDGTFKNGEKEVGRFKG